MLKPTKPQAKWNKLVTLEKDMVPLIWSPPRVVGIPEEGTNSLLKSNV